MLVLILVLKVTKRNIYCPIHSFNCVVQ